MVQCRQCAACRELRIGFNHVFDVLHDTRGDAERLQPCDELMVAVSGWQLREHCIAFGTSLAISH